MAVNSDENIDQAALRKWIEAGLAIPEVRELNGDAGYLLNNMIAKYTLASSFYAISERALAELYARGVDLSVTYSRRAFYGKQNGENPFIYEHAVPVGVVRRELLGHAADPQRIKKTLASSGRVAVLLRVEDQEIRSAGLASRMPDSWKFGHDPLARYQAVGTRLSTKVLHVTGAICR